MKKSHRIGLAGGVVAVTVLGGGAVALANSATPVPTASRTSTDAADAPGGPDRRADHEARHAERAAALAAELGLSAAQVTAAQEAAHESIESGVRPTTPPTDAERKAHHEAMTKAFAKELGITVEKLDAAMLVVAEKHLAAEVKAGRITQAQADARLKAIQNGDVPDGPHGRGPGGDHGVPDSTTTTPSGTPAA